MAFRRVSQETADEMAVHAAQTSGTVRGWHAGVARDLLKLVDTTADANTRLAAVERWRDDQEARRVRWATLALLQIGSGDRPEDVCAELGIGRTALQQAVRVEGSKLAAFTQFLYTASPKRKKEVA